MNNRHLFITTVICVQVTIAIAVGVLPFFFDDRAGSLSTIPLLVTVVSQMSLLSLWLVFGQGDLQLRGCALSAGGVALVLCSIATFDWFAVTLVFGPALYVAVFSLIARRRWQLTRVDRATADNRGSLQFSLGFLAVSAVILATLLAAYRLNPARLFALLVFGIQFLFTPLGIVFGVALAAVSLASFRAPLVKRQPFVQMMIVTTLAVAVGWISGSRPILRALGGLPRELHRVTEWSVFLWGSVPSNAGWWCAATLALIALMIQVSLLLFRAAGYRIVRRASN